MTSQHYDQQHLSTFPFTAKEVKNECCTYI